jgi:hypothetical protein
MQVRLPSHSRFFRYRALFFYDKAKKGASAFLNLKYARERVTHARM